MDSRDVVQFGRPNLFRPNLVMGFEGWADAARISSGVVGQLRDRLRTKRLAEVRPDEFYIFQSPEGEARRPHTDVEEGLIRELKLPSTAFWFFKNRRGAPDLILALAAEPELRWNRYAEVVLDLAQDFSVERIYTIGGTYNSVPHTVAPIVTAVISDDSLAPEMARYGIGLAQYEGPSSIHTLLAVAARERGLQAVGLWGHAPYYVQVPNARVCHGVLSRLAPMLDVRLDLQELSKAAEYLDEQVNDVVRQRPELREYVTRLEQAYGGAAESAAGLLDADIIREVEEFLRRSREDLPPGDEGSGP